MRNTFINTIIDAHKTREDVFFISGNAGLSMTGFKVYIYNIIPFLLYRCYEQVRNDISLFSGKK